MAAEHDSVELRLCRDEVAEAQPEVEAGTLPVEPAEPAAECGFDVLAAVGRRCERDQGVGMEMVDVSRRQEAVQRRIDRRNGAARAEAGVVEQTDHAVLVVDARIDALEAAQPLQIDEREAVGRQRAEVAAGALDGEHVARVTGDRILQLGPSRTCCHRRSW